MTFTAPFFQNTDYNAFINLFEQQVEVHADKIPMSDKGTVKRQAVVDEYSDMIAELYDDFLNQNPTCTATEKDAMDWPKQHTASYLVDSAAEVLDLHVSELLQECPVSPRVDN
ncbi:uncharacterized protein BYT42DRAFT_611635 [Radiomyces spectabilis]|uniref:uncharacterized protein n=1 Tax=Radiomyces spectabilis TaxID=64574 RepID=UPI002220E813|nr:uncharacterized protein BYT42DRAFT_611635 [Radiomyces spectabilis]KAI8388611.1 hypothetical protein BYT42DRAFT_611635 [Radiomyces spectabilis]